LGVSEKGRPRMKHIPHAEEGNVRRWVQQYQRARQLLEAMSRDLGGGSAGFTRNFVYDTLALSNNTYIQFWKLLINHRIMLLNEFFKVVVLAFRTILFSLKIF
jgi:hypothetical protein